MPLPVQNQKKSNNPHLSDNNKKLERNTPDEHRYTPLLGKTQRNFEKKSIILPDQTHQKVNNPPLPIKAKTVKVRIIQPRVKCTPLLFIKYFTIN